MLRQSAQLYIPHQATCLSLVGMSEEQVVCCVGCNSIASTTACFLPLSLDPTGNTPPLSGQSTAIGLGSPCISCSALDAKVGSFLLGMRSGQVAIVVYHANQEHDVSPSIMKSEDLQASIVAVGLQPDNGSVVAATNGGALLTGAVEEDGLSKKREEIVAGCGGLPLSCLTFSQSLSHTVIASCSHTALLFDTRMPLKVQNYWKWQPDDPILSMDANISTLACGTSKGKMVLFDLRGGLAATDSHVSVGESGISGVQWMGYTLVSCTLDGSLHQWHQPETIVESNNVLLPRKITQTTSPSLGHAPFVDLSSVGSSMIAAVDDSGLVEVFSS